MWHKRLFYFSFSSRLDLMLAWPVWDTSHGRGFLGFLGRDAVLYNSIFDFFSLSSLEIHLRSSLKMYSFLVKSIITRVSPIFRVFLSKLSSSLLVDSPSAVG